MLLELTVGRALQLIGPSKILLEEDIVPSHFPKAPNSPYRHGYDWLYQIERKVIQQLKPWLASHRLVLVGEHGLLSEGLSNAFCHGHARDAQSPIHIMIRVGQEGVLVEIRDTGQGFDVRRTMERFHTGKAYFSVAGNGILRMAESRDFGVFFNSVGNAFYILHLFAGGLSDLMPDRGLSDSGKKPTGGHSPQTVPARKSPSADLKPWIRGAALRRMQGKIHRLDLSRELADALLRMGSHLLRLSEELTQNHLKAGRPTMIHIQTPQASLLFCRESTTEIAAWLQKDTNPTIAYKLIRDYVVSAT